MLRVPVLCFDNRKPFMGEDVLSLTERPDPPFKLLAWKKLPFIGYGFLQHTRSIAVQLPAPLKCQCCAFVEAPCNRSG